MNVGAALYLGGKADNLAQGIHLAGSLIDSGAAMQTLQKLITLSHTPEEQV